MVLNRIDVVFLLDFVIYNGIVFFCFISLLDYENEKNIMFLVGILLFCF